MKKLPRSARIGNARFPAWLDEARDHPEQIAVTAELMRGYAEADCMNAAAVPRTGKMLLHEAEAFGSLRDTLEGNSLKQNQRP